MTRVASALSRWSPYALTSTAATILFRPDCLACTRERFAAATSSSSSQFESTAGVALETPTLTVSQADHTLERLADLGQGGITRLVPQAIVVVAEVIEVDHDDR